MLKVKIISVGKIKEKSMQNIISEYEKRLKSYIKFESIVLNDIQISSNPSSGEIENTLKKEAKSIENNMNLKAYNIVLCIEGKKFSSELFAKEIEKASMNHSDINIIIGSSYGIHKSIKEKANLKLSMSEMTFPHNIARLMITEQIYRAFKINSNENYHK